jgi:hypothetical protein
MRIVLHRSVSVGLKLYLAHYMGDQQLSTTQLTLFVGVPTSGSKVVSRAAAD